MGEKVDDILQTFNLTEEDTKKYKTVKDKFGAHFVKMRNTIYATIQSTQSCIRCSQSPLIASLSILSSGPLSIIDEGVSGPSTSLQYSFSGMTVTFILGNDSYIGSSINFESDFSLVDRHS